jgi:hypothetical protein
MWRCKRLQYAVCVKVAKRIGEILAGGKTVYCEEKAAS